MSLLPGYQICATLYDQGNSTVYRALREADGQNVILKCLRAIQPAPGEIARFKREFSIAARVDHPSIIRPLALQQHNTLWVMTLEDIGGRSLDQLLADEHTARLAPLDVLDIALQLCDALDVVHHHKVVHKDINPSNLVWNTSQRRLQLIDFGIASELQQENPAVQSLHLLEGTLPYISPEHSGRMNRQLDYRADFYSLGATLYELLAGNPPFVESDAIALVHCHMAKAPDFSTLALARLPAALLALLQKLLAKNPEDRYQSHGALRKDLRLCQQQLLGDGQPAALGSEHHDGEFRIPQRLYGRTDDIVALLDTFARMQDGGSQLVLIAGYSGVGKSALVNEVHKPIVACRGYFAAGKCDQYQRNTPYAVLIQAFQDLLHQLLTEPAEQVARWSTDLQHALAEHGAVMVELIPELALLLGPQPPAPALPPLDAQTRLHHLFLRLVQVFARREHPLALFLDDLQWVDTPTLRLIELLLNAVEPPAVLIIGAYRDNEVDPLHPLTAMLAQLTRLGIAPQQLTLQPLSQDHVTALVADTLGCDAANAAPLAELCQRKTRGNPFFLGQFLRMLHERKLIAFDFDRSHWQWNLAELEQAAFTDNVVALMIDKIRGLPAATQQLLQQAATLGNRFDLATLALVAAQPPSEVQQTLWPALEQDLVRPQSDRYKYLDEASDNAAIQFRFLHDRVQQAAYALLDTAAQQQQHLHIGRCLLAANLQPDEQLFAIVEHFNVALPLLDDDGERLRLAELNHQAGCKAQASAAYSAASRHQQLALSLLPGSTDDALRHRLLIAAAEAAYLNAEFELAESLYPQAQACSHDPLATVACYTVQVNQYQLQGRFLEAIAIQRQGLALLGIVIPDDADTFPALIAESFASIAALSADRDSDALLRQGEMTDPHDLAAMQLLYGMCYACYLGGQQALYPIVALMMTRLSLTRGNSDLSAFAYVLYAFLSNLLAARYEVGRTFGRLALELANQRQNVRIRGSVHFLYATYILYWTQPLRGALHYYDNSFRWCLESGDFVNVGYIVAVRATDRLILGQYLPELLTQCEQDLQLLTGYGQIDMVDCTRVSCVQSIRNLMGLTHHPHRYDDDGFSEAGFLADYADKPLHLAYYYHSKIRNAYLLQDPAALQLSEQLLTVESFVPGQCKVPETVFFCALILSRALQRPPPGADCSALRARLDALVQRLAAWALQCPDNFAARHLLVAAECAILDGEQLAAQQYYRQAIQSARDNGYVNVLAIACECFGRYWQQQQLTAIADLFLHQALTAYHAWGADGKSRQLLAEYPQLELITNGNPQPQHSDELRLSHSGTATTTLDLTSIIKATHALSGEIGMSRVLARLLDVVRENAGAECVRLLLQQDDDWLLEAESDGEQHQVLQQEPVRLDDATHPRLPLTLLRYVIRTGEEVVESNLSDSNRFNNDAYVRMRQPCSVICLPILRFGQVIGVLYLENNLVVGAFTQERVAFLRVLAMQALIAIDNARLYDRLEQQVAERTAHLNRVLLEQKAILDNAVAGIAFIRHHTFIRCNRGFEQMFGYAAGELDGQATRQLYPDEETYRHIDLQLQENALSLEGDLRAVRKDGEPFWCAFNTKPINPQDPDAGLVLVVLDISARKAAEQATQEARQRAEDATRTKSLFLANMSHEIRTPMNAILGMARLALRTAPDARQRGYLQKILGAGENLLGILGDILDFSKIEAGKLTLESVPFSLDEVLEPLSDQLVLRTLDKPVEAIFHVAANVPSRLIGDPLRLQQILGNLASNAAKFTEHGEITVSIHTVSRSDSHATLQFAVSDSGIGIESARLATLFQSFTQADGSITRRYGGTGLGLAICKQLVDMMDGDIQASSTPGQGSCFSFQLTLPLAASTDNEAPLPSLRVLVVDDNPLARDALCDMLQALGQQAHAVDNGMAALHWLRRAHLAGAPVQLVLMDWNMPGWNGIETITHIRADHTLPSPPAFLMITAYARDEVLAQAEAAGINAVLHKPVRPSLLQRQLRLLLAGHAGERPAPQTVPPDGDSPHFAGRRILLVDDNALNREVAQGLLEHSGLHIDVAENGQDAIEAIDLVRYDLVLMDIQMPELDGLEATRRIRSKPQHAALPIIAMTAHAMDSDRQASLAAGLNDHLGKPFLPQELYAILQRWLPARGAAETTAPPVSMRQPPSAQQLIGSGMGAQMHQRLRRHFITCYQELPARLQQLQAQQDWAAIQQQMHGLKAAAAYVDAGEVSCRASEIERDLLEQQTATAAALLPSLIHALSSTLTQLQQEQRQDVAQPSPNTPQQQAQHELATLLLTRLKCADSRADETLNTLQQMLPDDCQDDIQYIHELLDEIEYEQAYRRARALLLHCRLPIGNAP